MVTQDSRFSNLLPWCCKDDTETTKSQVVPISWFFDKPWLHANVCSPSNAQLTQWLQPSCLLTKFHGATEQSVHKITAKLEDISVWASFHRICPVVATGVTARRLQRPAEPHGHQAWLALRISCTGAPQCIPSTVALKGWQSCKMSHSFLWTETGRALCSRIKSIWDASLLSWLSCIAAADIYTEASMLDCRKMPCSPPLDHPLNLMAPFTRWLC